MSGERPSVLVLGAGAIGLATAWYLARRGCSVTVVDSGGVGGGASSVNAGWVAPSFSGPVPAPGLAGTTARWMIRPDSPFFIRPRPSPGFARWLLAFWRNCRDEPHARGRAALATLNMRTMALFDELAADLGAAGYPFEMHARGIVLAYTDTGHFDAEVRAFDWLEAAGFGRIEVAPPAELEPALADNVRAAFLVPGERHIDPRAFTRSLAAALAAAGVTIMTGLRAAEFDRRGARIAAVDFLPEPGAREAGGHVSEGPAAAPARTSIAADHVVAAGGAWTPAMLRPLGIRVPIEAGKGYALDFAPPPVVVGRAVYLHEHRVAISPLEGSLRLSGTMELAGPTLRIAQRRVRAIARAGASALRYWPAAVQPVRVAAGLRPLTPDGLPVIGRAAGFSNLWLASGHAMLGITLAPATGELLAEALTSDWIPPVMRPFDPGRFS